LLLLLTVTETEKLTQSKSKPQPDLNRAVHYQVPVNLNELIATISGPNIILKTQTSRQRC